MRGLQQAPSVIFKKPLNRFFFLEKQRVKGKQQNNNNNNKKMDFMKQQKA